MVFILLCTSLIPGGSIHLKPTKEHNRKLEQPTRSTTGCLKGSLRKHAAGTYFYQGRLSKGVCGTLFCRGQDDIVRTEYKSNKKKRQASSKRKKSRLLKIKLRKM